MAKGTKQGNILKTEVILMGLAYNEHKKKKKKHGKKCWAYSKFHEMVFKRFKQGSNMTQFMSLKKFLCP